MRSYAQVVPQFWVGKTGKDIRKAGPEVQVIAMYLMTCPSSNMIGLYYLPMPVLCHETGLSDQGACKALTRLSEIGFSHYDPHEEVIWVPNMAKYQLGDNLKIKDKRHGNVAAEVAKYSKSKFFQCFMEIYGKAYRLISAVNKLVEEDENTKPLGRGMHDHREEQEQEQEQEQEGGACAPEGENQNLVGTPDERKSAREAFDRWSHVSRGCGLKIVNGEAAAVHAIMADLDQGPPVVRGRESIPPHKLVALAADQLREEGVAFEGIKYACRCVSNRVKKWASNGMPNGERASPGRAPPHRVETLQKPVKYD